MEMLIFYTIDTETTGLKSGYHEIIQASIIRHEDGFQRTVNVRAEYPNRASIDALKIQNKTFSDLKNGIERNQAVEELISFIEQDNKTPGHRCIVGHNVPFDRRFLHAMFEASNKKFPANLWLCTKEFTRKLAKKKGIVKPKLTLASSLEIAGIQPKLGAHNAVVDSKNTFELFNTLMTENLNYVSIIKNFPHNL